MAVMAGASDPFKPPPDATFTKGGVNRAGQLLRCWYLHPQGETPEDHGTTFDELVDAMIAVTPEVAGSSPVAPVHAVPAS